MGFRTHYLLYLLPKLGVHHQFSELNMSTYNKLDANGVMDEFGLIRPQYLQSDPSEELPDGIYEVWSDDGDRLIRITYSAGIPNGQYVDYWSNGIVATEGSYCHGKKHGPWHYYTADGSLSDRIIYDLDIEVRQS